MWEEVTLFWFLSEVKLLIFFVLKCTICGHNVSQAYYISFYHASDKIVGILLDKYWSPDAVKITVFGVEIRIGRVIEFEAGGEKSKMADDGLVALDLS